MKELGFFPGGEYRAPIKTMLRNSVQALRLKYILQLFPESKLKPHAEERYAISSGQTVDLLIHLLILSENIP